MIFIFTDPGTKGAISAIDENEQILFSVGLEKGLPPEDFIIQSIEQLRASPKQARDFLYYVRWKRQKEPFFTEDEIFDCRFGIEIADYKNVEVGSKKASGKVTMTKLAYKAGINTGKIIHWFTERGVHDMIEFKPREWQTIFKGFGGNDSKEKVLNCLLEKYCHNARQLAGDCKVCVSSKPCSLFHHGIIGPRGGYNDGKGDSLCGAIHLKNYIKSTAWE